MQQVAATAWSPASDQKIYVVWIGVVWAAILILVAMAAWDLWRRRRIHPAVLFGAALLWTGEIITTILNFSPTWRDVMVRLVNAWGYAG